MGMGTFEIQQFNLVIYLFFSRKKQKQKKKTCCCSCLYRFCSDPRRRAMSASCTTETQWAAHWNDVWSWHDHITPIFRSLLFCFQSNAYLTLCLQPMHKFVILSLQLEVMLRMGKKEDLMMISRGRSEHLSGCVGANAEDVSVPFGTS